MNKQRKSPLAAVLVGGLIGLGGYILAAPAYAHNVVLPFVTHAEFFSTETHQSPPIDPQVFVAQPSATAGVGPQGIAHAAGVRNARIGDAGSLHIVNAQDKPLGLSLAAWLGATGKVTLMPMKDGHEKVKVLLSHLKPGGTYSLFENHFDQKPIGFTPLDGTGKTNSFVASRQGKATVTVIAPEPLTHDNAVLLVYHSDGKAHGMSRGNIGVDAHHQLIARP
ncbi:hypothetical protein [Bordetella sp. FB-8]|uniref:hypothetical protein n=1 Tax=Bordetella sp. FB-8 TaxID=1159870 RepID=UPI0003A2B7F2|nr:hypothetical protein [Bordetella sp. FB-8]